MEYKFGQTNLNQTKQSSPVANDVLEQKLLFGKHKGKTYNDLIKHFPAYMDWLDANNILKDDIKIAYTKFLFENQKNN